MKKLIALVALAIAAPAFAEPDAYFMVSVLEPAQLPTKTSVVAGARIGAIYGVAQRVYGIDIGLIGAGRVYETACGLQIGGLNISDGTGSGLQFGLYGNSVSDSYDGAQIGIYNGTGGCMSGFSLGLLSFHEETAGFEVAAYQRAGVLEGAQFGGVNVATHGAGAQIGAFNRAGARFGKTKSIETPIEDFDGAQIGLWNRADRIDGFQFGIVNTANSLNGLQIGLVNVADNGSWAKTMPFANWRF